jgi:hypothetical protein
MVTGAIAIKKGIVQPVAMEFIENPGRTAGRFA